MTLAIKLGRSLTFSVKRTTSPASSEGPFTTIAALRSDSGAPRRRFHVLRVRAAFGGQRRLSFSASCLPLLPFRDFEKSRGQPKSPHNDDFQWRLKSQVARMRRNNQAEERTECRARAYFLPRPKRRQTGIECMYRVVDRFGATIKAVESMNGVFLSLKMCERMEGGSD